MLTNVNGIAYVNQHILNSDNICRGLSYESNLHDIQGQVKLIMVIEVRIKITSEKEMALTGKGYERVC